jgi:hypothetical protein
MCHNVRISGFARRNPRSLGGADAGDALPTVRIRLNINFSLQTRSHWVQSRGDRRKGRAVTGHSVPRVRYRFAPFRGRQTLTSIARAVEVILALDRVCPVRRQVTCCPFNCCNGKLNTTHE